MIKSIQSYRDLEVWKKSMDLVTDVYQITKSFPKEEAYGLTSQLRRSAVSVPSNIAEGKSRRTTKEYLRFLDIAYGSLAEMETQLHIARNLGYIEAEQIEVLFSKCAEIGKMLNGLITSLEKKLFYPESRILNPESSKEDA